MAVVMQTTKGDMRLELFTDNRPKTCINFLKLCKMKYYNLNLLFSVEREFVAQTGDPTGTGRGGSSIFQMMYGEQARFYEGEKVPVIKHSTVGMLSMVSCGSNLYGSQFFVTLGENLDSLDNEHLVFGKVIDGFEVIKQLNQVLVDKNGRPYQDICITHMLVLEDPFPDAKNLTFPDSSPIPADVLSKSDYIAASEKIDENEGKSIEVVQEEIAEKEAKARATILEMVGDIPDSDVAPPENVLFVCKLNPVTTSEDLELIFQRFGKIECCEVIIDKVTSNSLQYAFIEFADKKSCEDAYFKMDNVLIDDRRIHVDFSQSVSKIRWKGKGRIEYFDDNGRNVEGSSKHFSSFVELKNVDKRLHHNHEKYKQKERQAHYKSKNRNYTYRNDIPERRHRYSDKFYRGNDNKEKEKYNSRPRDEDRYLRRDRYSDSSSSRSNQIYSKIDKQKASQSYHKRQSRSKSTDSKPCKKVSSQVELIPSDDELRDKLYQILKKDLKKSKNNSSTSSSSDSSSDEKPKKRKKKNKKNKKKLKKKKHGSSSDS